MKEERKEPFSHWLSSGNPMLPCLLLMLGVLILYLPCLSFDFFGVDDWVYVQKNPFLQSFSWNHLRTLLTTSFVDLWLPGTMLSFFLDHAVWGGNAFGYHLTNVAIHLVNIFLVYRLFLRLDCPIRSALFASALFALHPVQVESVVWISERKNVLSFFFFLLSCLEWQDWLHSRKKSSLFRILFFFCLSVFSKPVFVFGPVLFAIGFVFLQNPYAGTTEKKNLKTNFKGSVLAVLLGCMLCSLVSISMTLYSHASDQSLALPLSYTLRERIFTAMTLPWAYAKNLFFPFFLSISYLPETVSGLFHLKVLYGILLTAAFFYFLFRGKHPLSIFWGTWVVITMAPVSTVIPIPTWMNDRYLYAPLPALSIFLVGILGRYFSWKKKYFAVSLLLFFVLAFLSHNQIMLWEDNASLFFTSMKHSPSSIQCRDWALGWTLGKKLKSKKQAAEIERLADQILLVQPEDSFAIYCKALCLMEKKKQNEALDLLYKGLKATPDSPYLNRTCGNILLEKGQYPKASRFYSFIPATEKDETVEALVDQMKILLNRRDFQTALPVGKLLLEKVPERVDSYNLLAVAQYSLGQYSQATATLKAGLKKYPEDEMLRKNLIQVAQEIRVKAN
jgi:protein O-mannosyl-transferase